MEPQFDRMPGVLDLSTTIPYRAYPEPYSFYQALGDVKGKSVLDLACGDGLYTRQLRLRGATRVVGVDISAVQIERAREIEARERAGIEYLIHDVAELPALDPFDVVTAVHLLHYAESRAHLFRMAARIFASVVPGGRFVTVVADPSSFDPGGPSLTRYGITMHVPEGVQEGDEVVLDVHTTPMFTIRFPCWTRRTHEQALAAAGFRNLRWIAMECPPEGEARLGEEFWRDFLANPHACVLTCER